MEWWLVFAVFLFLFSALLLVAEVFVPSGGLISLCALACLIAGIVIFFNYSTAAGWIGIGLAVVMIPSVLIIAYKIFPKTRFGRSVTLTPVERETGDAIPDTGRLKDMLGKTGKVITPLRPVGTCQFGDNRFECVAESGFVVTGQTVKIIRVQGTQLTVRLLQEENNERA